MDIQEWLDEHYVGITLGSVIFFILVVASIVFFVTRTAWTLGTGTIIETREVETERGYIVRWVIIDDGNAITQDSVSPTDYYSVKLGQVVSFCHSKLKDGYGGWGEITFDISKCRD